MAEKGVLFNRKSVRHAVEQSSTYGEALIRLGLRAHADNYRRIREASARYDAKLKQELATSSSKEEIEDALKKSGNMSEMCKALGLAPASKSNVRVVHDANVYGLAIPDYVTKNVIEQALVRLNRNVTDDEIYQAVNTEKTVLQVITKTKLPITKETVERVRAIARERGVDLPYRLEEQTRPRLKGEDILIKNSPVSRSGLKTYIVNSQLLDDSICSECGILEWNGASISLHLDHINGINNDNRIENLRFLCPNCHSQTETYCRRVQYPESLEVE